MVRAIDGMYVEDVPIKYANKSSFEIMLSFHHLPPLWSTSIVSVRSTIGYQCFVRSKHESSIGFC